MKGVLGARGFQLLFELIDLLDLEEAVVNGEMTQDRGLDLRCVDMFERRAPLPPDPCVDLGHEKRRQDRKGGAHTEDGCADLRARMFVVMYRAANVLGREVAE